MERVCTPDAPKKKGGRGSVDKMMEKEDAVDALLEGYMLPLDDTAAAALQFTVASDDMTWQSIYQHCHPDRAAPSKAMAAVGATANGLLLLTGDGAAAQSEAA